MVYIDNTYSSIRRENLVINIYFLFYFLFSGNVFEWEYSISGKAEKEAWDMLFHEGIYVTAILAFSVLMVFVDYICEKFNS